MVLLFAAIAYYILQTDDRRAPGSRLRRSPGRSGSDLKGKLSPVLYLAAIGLAFVSHGSRSRSTCWSRSIWLVPDRRLERL